MLLSLRNMIIPIVLSWILLLAPSGYAWGRLGHRHIAQGTQRLLPSLNTDLINASLWPDRIKGMPGWRWTAPLHYISTRDAPPQVCTINSTNTRPNLLTSIVKYEAELSSIGPKEPGEDPRFEFSLGMLVHLIQDLGQPLHVSGTKRGGNDQPIRIGKRTWNLHEVWDTLFVEQLLAIYGEERMLTYTTSCDSPGDVGGTVEDWGLHSAGLVCSVVYVDFEDTDTYIKRALPVVLEQLRLSTCRCAHVLRRALAPDRLLMEQS